MLPPAELLQQPPSLTRYQSAAVTATILPFGSGRPRVAALRDGGGRLLGLLPLYLLAEGSETKLLPIGAGVSDYLDALNSRETVFLREGEIVTEQAEPDLGNHLLQRGTELFSLPTEQTSILRLAEIAPGTPFTVIYGL